MGPGGNEGNAACTACVFGSLISPVTYRSIDAQAQRGSRIRAAVRGMVN
jgi:hypothetical protein